MTTDNVKQMADVRSISSQPLAFGPTPLRKRPDAQRPYPTASLGPDLALVASELNRVIGAPSEIVGQSLLASVMFLAQAHREVIVDGRSCPCSGFFMTFAESGERKSSVDKVVLKEVFEEEKSRLIVSREKQKTYDSLRKIYDRKMKAIIRDSEGKDNSALEKEIKGIGPAPIPPSPFIMLIQEPTYEAMVQLFQKGSTHLGLFSDEGGRMLGGSAMKSDNMLKTLTGLSEAWDGSPISRVRVGDGFDKIYGKRLSMHLMIQPDVAEKLLSDKIAKAQGIMARTLMVKPHTIAGDRDYQAEDITQTECMQRFYARVRSILKLNISVTEDGNRELTPKQLVLDDQAKSHYLAFYKEIETQLGVDQKYSTIRSFGSKAPEHALRIAGALTFFDSEWNASISEEFMLRAITLVRYYIDEHLRIFEHQNLRPALANAENLYNYCLRKKLTEISLTDILQLGPVDTRISETAHQAISVLIEYGWFKKVAKSRWMVVYEQ